jgi:hypothetical protein
MTERKGMIDPEGIDEDFIAGQSTEVASVELDGEAVLYDESDGSIHVLNATATVLWSCFDGSTPLREIISDLAESFALPADQMRGDVLVLAKELGAKGLLAGVRRSAEAEPPT